MTDLLTPSEWAEIQAGERAAKTFRGLYGGPDLNARYFRLIETFRTALAYYHEAAAAPEYRDVTGKRLTELHTATQENGDVA